MEIKQAILQALHDNPADEASWRVLTDWLEEHGQERRAELLRLHRFLCSAPEGPERHAAEVRLRDLLAEGVRPCLPVLTNSIGMELVLIPAGTFQMGSPAESTPDDERPLHEVEITKPFYLGAHLVTQGQFHLVTGNNPTRFHSVPGCDASRLPVDTVTWSSARTFTEQLTALPEEKAAGRVYRLPTEAEWEYACRAWFSPAWMFHFGDTLSSLQANINGGDGAPFLRRPAVVGSYPPNAWGLYDLHGNLAEWCSDWYQGSVYDRSRRENPRGARRGTARVLRGGAWGDGPHACRTSRRIQFIPTTTHDALGLRVVMRWPACRRRRTRKKALA
jgi:uncharacterized protein (TIGR02996 family)